MVSSYTATITPAALASLSLRRTRFSTSHSVHFEGLGDRRMFRHSMYIMARTPHPLLPCPCPTYLLKINVEDIQTLIRGFAIHW